MFTKRLVLGLLSGTMACLFMASSWAADLAEIKKRGEIRHIGIRYANFVTGAGDGLDVELMQGFAKRIGVSYKLVYSDFYSVIRDLLGKDVVRKDGEVTLTGDYPVKGDVISTGFTMLPWREAILMYSDPVLPSQVLLVAPAESDHPCPAGLESSRSRCFEELPRDRCAPLATRVRRSTAPPSPPAPPSPARTS